jgi:hypothetical protein
LNTEGYATFHPPYDDFGRGQLHIVADDLRTEQLAVRVVQGLCGSHIRGQEWSFPKYCLVHKYMMRTSIVLVPLASTPFFFLVVKFLHEAFVIMTDAWLAASVPFQVLPCL